MTDRPEVRFLDRTTPPHIGTLILLAGISALCMNVFLPSLPGMAVYFDADYSLMQLSVAVYLAVNAVLQIIVGPISDKMGRRPVILWGVGLFLLATLGCIYAPNAQVFLAFRMAQAVVVAAMVLSRAVVPENPTAPQAPSHKRDVQHGNEYLP
jgi:DHA1 family bicyclomycin/chloramphenicol resistance-like MFS transporter